MTMTTPPADTTAFVCRAAQADYPSAGPFHPAEAWPEYGFGETSAERNHAYEAIRSCLRLAGLDADRYGGTDWNPLADLIHPGETVLLKPNLVKQDHPRDPEGWRYVLTHGSIVRAVADYVFKAVGSSGRVVLADSPQTDSSFTSMVRLLGLDAVRDFYVGKGLSFELVDLRQEEWVNRGGVIVSRSRLPGDPHGAVAFDLGEASELAGHRGAGHYYGADYDTKVVNRHHLEGRHEYLVAGSAIAADVIFSLPKLKTHKKAGITVSLKNLVGLNCDKNLLPHYTEGPPAMGGDEHPTPGAAHRLERALARTFRQLSLKFPERTAWVHRTARRAGIRVFGDGDRVIRSGNWHGNDTIWRMCLDLNRIVLYGGTDGRLRAPGAASRKRHFVLVDGILAGDGAGPTDPDVVPAGVVVFGTNPATVDAACARIMGFDIDRIPIVREAFSDDRRPIADWAWRDVVLRSDRPEWNGPLEAIPLSATLRFNPHFGWKGHIELAGSPVGGGGAGDASAPLRRPA